MGDSIKFGPEWLRNMSNDTGGLSSAATSSTGGGGTNNFAYPNNQTRYPLAEYRYGREEMLSLHDKNFKLPELLPKFNKLFIEKMQSPLALLPPTADDDTPRGLTPIGGTSSERSGLGLNANSSSGSALSGISNAIGSIGMSARGIRGSSIDRGRGRARGGLYHSSLGNYQSRSGFVYDEDTRGAAPRAERSWAERNGNSTAETEWSPANSSPSPRKDYSQLRSGPDGSWRRNRVDEDGQIANGTNEGWRNSSSITNNSSYKWPVRSTSWRGGDGDANSSFGSDGGAPRLERSKSTHSSVASREMDGTGGPSMRRFGMNANTSWDEDNYPEWAMEDPIEGGGSFDASGAFLGNVDKSTGEKTKYQSGDGLRSDKNQSQSTKCDEKSESINSNGANENDNSMTDISDINNSIEDDTSKPNDDSLIESSSSRKNNKSGGR